MIELSLCFVLKERSRQPWNGGTLRLFPNCIDSIRRATVAGDNIELVIADFGSTDWPLHEWLPSASEPIPAKVVHMNGDFSRGKGLNTAAVHSSHDVMFFLDVDMLVSREVLTAAFSTAVSGRAFVPVYHDLDVQGNVTGPRLDGFGCVALSKQLFEESGKWPEFFSWGGEDTILFERLSKLTSIERNSIHALHHQWHPDDWKRRFYRNSDDFDYFNHVRASHLER